jgi:hypothetical protein
MISRRILIGRLATLFLGSTFVSACTTGQPSQPLLSADTIAREVAHHYGESSPVIVGVTNTETDNPPHDLMYLIALSGHFQKDGLVATSLGFSALSTRMYAWNIRGYDPTKREIWREDEFPSRSK